MDDHSMPPAFDYRPLHFRALADCTAVIAGIEQADLARDTPCAGWNLGTLLGHCIGQNHGFSTAVENGDAPDAAYAHRVVDAATLQPAWRESVSRLTTAFAAADPDRVIRLAEFTPRDRYPLSVVIGFQLLDTVVHTWDIATALEQNFRQADELIDATLRLARLVPQTVDARQRPGAAFGPVLTELGGDPWAHALALLGRADQASEGSSK
jgi:uncharacterized protein (TIGR03086 family)